MQKIYSFANWKRQSGLSGKEKVFWKNETIHAKSLFENGQNMLLSLKIASTLEKDNNIFVVFDDVVVVVAKLTNFLSAITQWVLSMKNVLETFKCDLKDFFFSLWLCNFYPLTRICLAISQNLQYLKIHSLGANDATNIWHKSNLAVPKYISPYFGNFCNQ